ncbi:CubicO group peptidase, beta-lactamase class C family [Pseudarcicella hirudinis]|uniref:CubicO group peptidase, beta-lactamase class C family n=1 Tax=Pseudarcicella hirudinis TaxID=1079859 RepID=A0A1I5RTH2_9BACT|nr:serine hydrolase domain-containing protein [Pseudarcicella hirudinis]SFP61822.1 CubicO group peptidase, beta-lactamase class C family [Pseudarcicella hirudinis]
MTGKRIIIALSFICFIPFTNLAQNKALQIDQLLQSYKDIQAFNGSVLVAKRGKIILQKGYGFANMESGARNTVNTKFRIASLSKQFTAMLIMQLKQSGLLNLGDPISKFLPYYRKDIGNKVTIYELLTQTSGIPDYTSRPDFFPDIATHHYTPDKFVEKFCSDSLQYEPGTRYSYCNSNYYILGAIIESITQKPYAIVLKEKIFDVAGMKDSGIDTPYEVLKNRANGYNYNYGNYTNASYINMASAIYAAGGIYSTIGDLLLWDEALYGEKLLSKENKDIMFTPFLNKYAFGIIVNKTSIPGINHEVTLMVHTGGINGFRSIMLREVEDREVIILLSNSVLNNNFDIDLNPVSNRIFSILNNLPYEKPKPSIGESVGEKVYQSSVEKAISFFQQAKLQAKKKYDFTNLESELNSLGYSLLSRNRTKDAVVVFKLNTEEFSKSWNVFDSYAEALLKDGQKEAALKNYRLSLKINPDNTNAATQIKILEAEKR